MSAKIGIAITTYNRIDLLRSVIAAVQTLSRSHVNLIICDDGSTDGTVDFLKSISIPYITGNNRGVYWNKNRGIFYLMNYSDSDVLILMDDDVMPQVAGWEFEWAEAVRRYGHVNNAFYREVEIKGGSQASDPGITQALGGQCMAFSREAAGAVGYMDPRFGRYGHEHTELTRRALRAGYGGLLWETDFEKKEYFFVIDGGISVIPSRSHLDPASLAANGQLLELFQHDPIYRHAWRDDKEMKILIGEIEASGLSRFGKAVAIPYGFEPNLYRKLNNDLPPDIDPLVYYVRQGHLENRPISASTPSVADHWVNISDHRVTSQSSICEYSEKHDVTSESAGAVNGLLTGHPQFHTGNEPEPWWMVDLGSVQPVGLIRIFNRIDSDVYQHRFRSFRIEGSSDGIAWFLLIREDFGVAPGGLDGRYYEVEVAGEPRCRFVRIIQQLAEFLHLDQVQIFSRHTAKVASPSATETVGSDLRMWTLTTAAGQPLGRTSRTGQLVCFNFAPPDVVPLQFVTTRGLPDLLLHIPAEASSPPLRLQSSSEPDRISIFAIERIDGQLVALRNPTSNKYLSARPAEGSEVVEVSSDRILAQAWEHFRLEEQQAPPGEWLTETARAFESALNQQDFGADQLAGWLQTSSTETVRLLFKPLLRMLPAIEFGRFATICLEPTSGVAQFLAAVFANDPWLGEAIPGLLDWQADRHCRSTAVALPSCDGMGFPGFLGDQPLSYTLACTMRRTISARRKLCILATARDEGPYLLEWIAYHRSLGVEHFFIYTNDLTDGSGSLLKELAHAGYITHIDNICENRTISPQLKAYGHALSCLPEILDFEWTAIIDLDEYITMAETEHRSLQQILDSPVYASGGGVALNWRMFSPAKTRLPIVAPIIARSWRREPALNHHVKTIIRTRQCNWSGPHAPEWTFPEERVVLNPKGDDYRLHKTSASTSFSDTPCYETMWVNHYFYKSFAEFVWKFSRNRGDTSANAKNFDPPEHFCREFVHFSVDSNTVADRSIEGRIAKCLVELDLLRSVPAIAQAERQVIDEVNRQLSGHLRQVASALNSPLAGVTREIFISEARYAVSAGPIFDVAPVT